MLARHRSAPRISEARTISALNHAHICGLFDIGHQDGTDFLVMEYLEGETLAARLAHAFEAATIDHAFRSAHRSSSGQCLDAVNAAVPRDVHLIVDN